MNGRRHEPPLVLRTWVFRPASSPRGLPRKGWPISATSRSAEGAEAIRAMGYRAFVFDGAKPLPAEALGRVSRMLLSRPRPAPTATLSCACIGDSLRARGSSAGSPISRPPASMAIMAAAWSPRRRRSRPTPSAATAAAGGDAVAAVARAGLPVHIFRLAGIYGPGRNQLVSLLDGTAKRVIKARPGLQPHPCRGHRQRARASIARPNPGRAYNVCDDEAAPPQDVVEFGAKLLGLPVPPAIPFEQAELSPMARSFYADSKRVSNARHEAGTGRGPRLSHLPRGPCAGACASELTLTRGRMIAASAARQTRDAVGALGEPQHGFAQQREVAGR